MSDGSEDVQSSNHSETKETDPNRDLLILMELKKRQISEYQAESNRMQIALDAIGMGSPCQTNFEEEPLGNLIDIFSEVAFQLGVDDTSEASLDLALSDLRLKVAKIPSENFQRLRGSENEKVEKLEAIKSLSLSEATLTKAEAEVQSQEVEINQMKKKIIFMAEKQKEYSRSAEKLSSSLKMSGYKKELTHDAIVELKNNLDNLRETELKPLRGKLDGYRGLPPNTPLALAKLAETEKELEDLTYLLTKEISEFHV